MIKPTHLQPDDQKNNTSLDQKKLAKLIRVIDQVYPSNWQLVWKSFLRGVFFGLGTTLGVSIVLAVLGFAVTQLSEVPVMELVIQTTGVEEIVVK